MNNENQVNGQPVVDTTSNVVGAQPVQPQQPVMEPMQPQQTYTPPAGYTQYQAPQQQYAAPVNQYQPQGQYQMYQAPQTQYQNQYQYRQPEPSAPGNGFCIASLVLGLCSLFFWWTPWLNLVIIVLAIIFGIVGLVKKHGDGKAIAGLILSGLVTIPTIMILFAYMTVGGIYNLFTNTNTYKNTYNYNYNTRRYIEDTIENLFD
jgi:hypothetical protein